MTVSYIPCRLHVWSLCYATGIYSFLLSLFFLFFFFSFAVTLEKRGPFAAAERGGVGTATRGEGANTPRISTVGGMMNSARP